MITRRSLLAAGAGLGAFAALGRAAAARAENAIHYFRIGTGASGGTYYPIGTAIANAISNPPGSRPCNRGGACGVPGLIATAQSTPGAVQNLEELAQGRFDAALAQADIVGWAYEGRGPYRAKPPQRALRLIATLYPEAVHVAARRDAGIAAIGDLGGKRVSLGELGSGTLVHAGLVLAAHGLASEDMTASYLRPGEAADALSQNRIDAMFLTGGVPVPALRALADAADIALVPIRGVPTEPLLARHPRFAPARIPDGAYRGAGAVATVKVDALLVTTAKADDALVYGIVTALWHANSRPILDRAHPIGRAITLDGALASTAAPLHPGAARFYREAGKLAPNKPEFPGKAPEKPAPGADREGRNQ